MAIRAELVAQAGIPDELIDRIVVYGELMCNKDLFRYNEETLYGTCPIFGAMIRPATNEAIPIITNKLGEAKFACLIRSSLED